MKIYGDVKLNVMKSFLMRQTFYNNFIDRHLLRLLEQLLRSPHTKYQAVHWQKLTVDYLLNTAACYFITQTSRCTMFQQTDIYCLKIIRWNLEVIRQVRQYFWHVVCSHVLLQNNQNQKSFKCIRDYKNRVSASIFYDNSQVDRHMYTDAVGGKSWSTKRREAVASDIKLINTVIYIDELLPVQQLARQTGILK